MSLYLSVAAVCFIACHGGPADHFSTFAEELIEKGHTVQIYATGAALKKFQEREIAGVIPFSLENICELEAASGVAKKCVGAAMVITDVGHPFAITVQKAVKSQAPNVVRLAYYDNPEAYVPGGYSAVAAKVMEAAQGVLFANAHLAQAPLYETPSQEISLPLEKRVGLGYYPLAQAAKIAQRRSAENGLIRSHFFAKHSLEDEGQKVLVYAGGNNEEYFTKAFPAFLQFLEESSQQVDLSTYFVLLQQHPGAKEKNLDGKLLQDWIHHYGKRNKAPRLFVSEFTSDDAQVVADAMLYYQTSMGPQFVLAGIPTIQVGHNTYEDILVKNKLCSVATNEMQWLEALAHLQNMEKGESGSKAIEEGLGISADWPERLERAVKSAWQSEPVGVSPSV